MTVGFYQPLYSGNACVTLRRSRSVHEGGLKQLHKKATHSLFTSMPCNVTGLHVTRKDGLPTLCYDCALDIYKTDESNNYISIL